MRARIRGDPHSLSDRRAFIATGVSLFFLLSLQAQQVHLTPPEKSSIEGLVVKAATSEPLNKAWLTLRKLDGREPLHITSTDARGRFVLRDLEPGQYRLWVERKGYVRHEYGQRAANRPGTILTLAPGQHLRDVVLRMIPTGAISGQVYDEDGEPTAGVRVQALRYVYVRGHRQALQAAAAITNDLGDYRLYGLAPGRYYVSATYTPGPRTLGIGHAKVAGRTGESLPEEGYAPTYYPGTNNPNRAIPRQLNAGDDVRGVDFTLLPTRTVRVRGRVSSTVIGRPGNGARIWLMPRESGMRGALFRNQTVVGGPQGAFELRGVTPGSYLLRAKWFEEGRIYTARQALDVGNADIDGINLLLAPGADLRGRVRTEGNPQFKSAGLRVLLEPRDDPEMGSASVSVKSDGTFVLNNLGSNVYDVTLTGTPEDFYLKAARLGSDDVLERGLIVSSGPPPGSLELVLSSAGARIEGSVLDGEQEAFSGATVVLVPETRHRDRSKLYQVTTTDQYGRFTLRGIPPGDYKLFAWDAVERGAYQDVVFLRPYEEQGEPMQVKEGARLSVQLRIIPAKE